MANSKDNEGGGDHEVIHLDQVIRGDNSKIIRLDKLLENALQNPSPDMRIDLLYKLKAEIGMIIVQTKTDLYTLKAMKEKHHKTGEMAYEDQMDKILSTMELLKKRVEQYEAIRTCVTDQISSVFYNATQEASGSSSSLLIHIQEKDAENNEKMRGVTQQLSQMFGGTESSTGTEPNDERGMESNVVSIAPASSAQPEDSAAPEEKKTSVLSSIWSAVSYLPKASYNLGAKHRNKLSE